MVFNFIQQVTNYIPNLIPPRTPPGKTKHADIYSPLHIVTSAATQMGCSDDS